MSVNEKENEQELNAEGVAKIIFRMKSSAAREFKVLAARQGISMQSVLQKAVEAFLKDGDETNRPAYAKKEAPGEYAARKKAQKSHEARKTQK